MSLIPMKRSDKGYQNMLEKYILMTGCKQTFRIEYNRANNATSIEKICAFDEVSIYNFLFKATFKCPKCKNYALNEIYFDCCNCGNNSYSTISFSVLNSGADVKAEIHLGIEKQDKSITSVSKETKKLLSNEKFVASWALTPKGLNFFAHFSADGKVTFVLEIDIEGMKPDGEIALLEQPKYPGILENLAKFFSEEYIDVDSPPDRWVDFTLYVGEHKIYCHQMVLSMSSGYFKRMIETNMKEAKENKAHLENIDLTTMKSLLYFMHSGKVYESEITVELLKAADFLDVMPLRQICIANLKKDVNPENVAALWKTSYAHNIEDLAHHILAYMAMHWSTLVEDKNVARLAKENDLWLPISLLLSERPKCI